MAYSSHRPNRCALAMIGLLSACAGLPHEDNPTAEADLKPRPPGLVTKVRTMGRHLIHSFTFTPVKQPLTAVRDLAVLTTTSAVDYTRDFARDAVGLLQRGRRTAPALNHGAGMDLAGFERRLDRITGTHRLPGNLELMIDGAEYFPRLLGAVSQASESVRLRTYIFDNDDFAVRVADLLKYRAEDISVRVMMDGIGSWSGSYAQSASLPASYSSAPLDIAGYLRHDARVKVRVLPNTWFAGDHTKAVIVDGSLAFVGGMNIGREYRFDWHDIMVAVTGPAVTQLAADFDSTWQHSTIGDLALLSRGARPAVIEAEDAGIRLLYTKPGNAQIHRAQLEAIKRARHHIYVQNAYFSDDRIRRGLIAARQRGVDVRVILPSRGDSGPMDRSNILALNDLVRRGVRVFVFPGMSHVKAAMFDGWVCFGSANFDRLSLRVNRELDIATSDPGIVAAFETRLFQPDFERSLEVTAPLPTRWSDRIYEMLADVML
jgi:cardiolipin synthase A/B